MIKEKKASNKAGLVRLNIPTVYKIDQVKNNKEADDTLASKALLVMPDFTGNKTYNESTYINFSIGNDAGYAPEALLVMQRFDTPRLHGHVGATPAWGGPAFYKKKEMTWPS